MSGVADALPPDVAAAAAAIANARAGRRGAPEIRNVLDILPQKLLDEVVDDARAVIEALAAIPPKPRATGGLRAADASVLGLDLGAGALCILARDKAGRASAVLWALSAEAAELAHDEAHQLWLAVNAVIRTLPDEAAPSQLAERTP